MTKKTLMGHAIGPWLSHVRDAAAVLSGLGAADCEFVELKTTADQVPGSYLNLSISLPRHGVSIVRCLWLFGLGSCSEVGHVRDVSQVTQQRCSQCGGQCCYPAASAWATASWW